MKRRRQQPPPRAEVRLELLIDTTAGAGLFEAMLRSVELEKQRAEENANDGPGTQKSKSLRVQKSQH